MGKKRYNGGIFILDSDHIPEGKLVTAAFLLLGSNWPFNCENDA
jgi:hypothetical protein